MLKMSLNVFRECEMDLKIKDVCEMLNVSETTIRRWLADHLIPAYKINGQFRFSRMEIEEWVMKQKVGRESLTSPLAPEEGKPKPSSTGMNKFSLFRALNKGNVYSQVKGSTKEEIIRESVKLMKKHLPLDSEMVTDLLLDRETLMPTALGHGIAVPHHRDIQIDRHYDIVSIVFPAQPIEYGALDGKPIHTLFFLFACNDKRHLNLLAKIAHLTKSHDMEELLSKHPAKEEILSFVKEWESSLPSLVG